MKDKIIDFWNNNWKVILPVFASIVLVVVIIAVVVTNRNKQVHNMDTLATTETESQIQSLNSQKEDTESESEVKTDENDMVYVPVEEVVIDEKNDPQEVVEASSAQGTSFDTGAVEAVAQEEAKGVRLGVDVSLHQGTIDWAKVKESGISFAMIRVGYRGYGNGKLVEDENAKYNMQQAHLNGIKVGVYFVSTAITEAEIQEEVAFVKDIIKGFNIDYPVAFDSEGFDKDSARHKNLDKASRTKLATSFMKAVANAGYNPIFYGSKYDLEHYWDMSSIEASYKVWVAQYISSQYSESQKSSYTGKYEMWQFTQKGSIDGIKGNVDINVYYTSDAGSDSQTSTDLKPNVEGNKVFKDCNETITAKEKVNLRDVPSQGDDSKVIATLLNGQTATRTGISDSGWSRVVYNGQTLYCVTSYTTTDLNYKPANGGTSDSSQTEETENSESETKEEITFEECDDYVSAKSAANLRTSPDKSDDSNIVIKVDPSVRLHRIGKSSEWSKVEYEGQILYCYNNVIKVVE